MPRLKDRNRQIPNGFRFALPEVGYKSRDFDSFSTISNQVSSIIKANPARAKQYGWPTDDASIADWIDDFNSRICQGNGWNDFITSGLGEVPYDPKSGPPLTRVAALAAGAKSLAEWLGEGNIPVDDLLATNRAKVCVACPLNKQGDLSNFFERATSELIRRYIENASDSKLTTPYDAKLGVCDACLCPMRLKVHTPLKHIIAHMPEHVHDDLDPKCWITAELLVPLE
jgi:hypothetical protein